MVIVTGGASFIRRVYGCGFECKNTYQGEIKTWTILRAEQHMTFCELLLHC